MSKARLVANHIRKNFASNDGQTLLAIADITLSIAPHIGRDQERLRQQLPLRRDDPDGASLLGHEQPSIRGECHTRWARQSSNETVVQLKRS